MKKTILSGFLLLLCLSGKAQSDSSRRPVYSVLPFAFFLPETDWGFGIGGIMSFRFKGEDTASSVSQVQLGASYTLRNQWLFYLPWRLFWASEKNLSYGELGYYVYVYPYYGIGARSRLEEEEFYDVTFPRVRINYLRETSPDLYFGIRYWLDDFNITGYAPEGKLLQSAVRGFDGGRVSGLGVVSNFDSRDNQFYPTHGWFVEAVALPHSTALGSNFTFLKLSLDAAHYHTIRKRHTFAVNAYWESNIGEVPFFNMAFLGGPRRLRGYIDGRFRDYNAAVLQAEYRWRFYKRFGLALFYGAGNVFEKFSGLQASLTKQTFGGGLRFQLSKREKVNLRLDAGFVPSEGANFYVTFGEAF